MSVKKSLLITLPVSSDDIEDAITIRTTSTNALLVDVLVDLKRFAINIEDLSEALQELREFNVGNRDEGHSTISISEIEHIPELEVMSLDGIPEKVVDDECPF